ADCRQEPVPSRLLSPSPASSVARSDLGGLAGQSQDVAMSDCEFEPTIVEELPSPGLPPLDHGFVEGPRRCSRLGLARDQFGEKHGVSRAEAPIAALMEAESRRDLFVSGEGRLPKSLAIGRQHREKRQAPTLKPGNETLDPVRRDEIEQRRSRDAIRL